MNTIKSLTFTLAFVAATAPAFANDGIPADVQAKWDENPVRVEAPTTLASKTQAPTLKAAPPYLHGLGERSLVPNPAFVDPRETRYAKGDVRRGSVPATRYVGA